MGKQLITLDELYDYCLKNNISNFNAKNPEDALIVRIPSMFEQSEDDYDKEFFLKGEFKSCHTLLNENGSFIKEDVMNKALPSFANKPILGAIVETVDENGESTLDFDGHNYNVTDDKMHKGEKRIEFVEAIIGIIPETNNIRMVKEFNSDKAFVYVTGYIYKNYTYASDILEKRQGAEVSVEISVSDFSFNAKEKYLSINEFKFSGITILGATVKPGMKGANVSIDNYTLDNKLHNEHSVDKLMSDFKELQTKFNHIYNIEKGGTKVLNIEALLTKYNKTIEDINFEYENLTEEELEIKFSELFSTQDTEENENNTNQDFSTPESKTETEATEFSVENGEAESTNSVEFTNIPFVRTVNENGDLSIQHSIKMEISHDDIRSALYSLISVYETEHVCMYIREVYDNYFIMDSWNENKLYKQGYAKEGDAVSLVGDRVEVWEVYLTENEKTALDTLKQNYEVAVQKLAEYAESELKAEEEELAKKKTKVCESDDYELVADTEEFKSLKEHAKDYTLEELIVEADLIFAKYAKAKFTLNRVDVKDKPKFVSTASTATRLDNSELGSFISGLQALGKHKKF